MAGLLSCYDKSWICRIALFAHCLSLHGNCATFPKHFCRKSALFAPLRAAWFKKLYFSPRSESLDFRAFGAAFDAALPLFSSFFTKFS